MALIDHKPRGEEKKSLTKQEFKEACKDRMVQTKIKLRSKWSAPLKYRVLMTFQLNSADRKDVAKIMVLATTPDKARKAIFGKAFWGYRDISLIKDFECGILTFKGLAVCLFYKRQTNEVEPIANEPVPIGALESEDDIWARLDLFSKSPRQLLPELREEMLEQSIQLEETKQLLRIRENQLVEEEKKTYKRDEIIDRTFALVEKMRTMLISKGVSLRDPVCKEATAFINDVTTAKAKARAQRRKG